MSYIPLNLPETLPPVVEGVIRHGVEPLLRDVHWMLATVIHDHSQNAMRRQLQIPIALTLLAAVAGVSTQLYQASGNTGLRFKNCLKDYYPWDIDTPSQVPHDEAANLLYDAFRTPVVHFLGKGDKGRPPIKFGQIFRGTDDAEARVEELERGSGRPTNKSFLVIEPDRYVLWLDPFYWGGRKLVERWAQNDAQVVAADKKHSKKEP